MELGFLLGQVVLHPLLLGDVRHHRDRATCRRPAAEDAIDPAVRRAVLEALA